MAPDDLNPFPEPFKLHSLRCTLPSARTLVYRNRHRHRQSLARALTPRESQEQPGTGIFFIPNQEQDSPRTSSDFGRGEGFDRPPGRVPPAIWAI